jgi:putative transposase
MYRRKVLRPEISNRLYELVQTIAKEKGFDIIECETYDCDHVSCIVSAPPKLSVTQIVKYIKGISGKIILKEYPEIVPLLWNNQMWNNSYFCETLGTVSGEAVNKYIERQKKCQH